MRANEVVKRNTAGMQVIKTLLALLENNYTMSELVENLNKKEKESIFNNSVISKYINTCRYYGIEIKKIQNKYYITHLPFGLNLNSQDFELLKKLQDVAQKIFSAKSNKIFNNFYERLIKFSNKQITKAQKENNTEIINLFKNAIMEENQISLILKTKDSIKGKPLEVIVDNNKNYFRVKSGDKVHTVDINKITGLEIHEQKYEDPTEVVFKLFGGLAARYSIREHEEIKTNNLPYDIVIVNKGEEKDILLSRLLRYDSKCEILSPQNYRDEMKRMLDNMLSNYGE